ncbi:RNA dependent RNA polymerase-domain-containing protein [Dichotomopilus funicola]|uniref:RNA dependent RNA polymerase-domain-containing protein n=1 Tax=Dichotomopilus funicola TaxID=1934379 RepID=A0AAN6ZNM1_9PEZI|nr:RNA dependent RNA polymerase-domain-containing protein [Dichotomopilus funicola]
MASKNTKSATKKPNLANLRIKLQDHVSLDDHEWKYQVKNLPSPQVLDQKRLMKTVSVITTGGRNEIVLTFATAEDNRAIRGDPLNKFLVVSIAELRAQPRGQKPETSKTTTNAPTATTTTTAGSAATQPLTSRECADYATRLLRTGIILQGVHYNFYGHSNSQLKSRTSMTVDPSRVEDIPDVETADYIFTDGCGLIAPRLAQELARRVGVVFRDRRYTPSVMQIRYRGYKGVVTVDPRMGAAVTGDKKVLLKMRKSMKKFAGGDDYSFSVVEYSKPYTYGYLNDEVIVLLSALGMDRTVLKRKQEEHFQYLAEASQDPRAAFRFLSYLNMPQLAEQVLLDSLDAVRPRIQALVRNEYTKMLNKREEQRCRILLPKSRLLFGICDAWGVLKEGECAVKITLEGDGQPTALKGCDVLVTRNPCLHPGDLQKFKVVDKPELSHLVDCIVFSTQGRRPAADMMSGGDLDGDTFFVCWDNAIVPPHLSWPAQYPGVKERLQFKPITDDDRLEYFARYTNASLGRVKNLYLDWARARGPMAEQCQELNRLFSQCVDGNRIRVPPKLEQAPAPAADAPPFILDYLHDAAKELIQRTQAPSSSRVTRLEGYDFDAIELLLSREDVAMSEFDLLRLTLRWCRKTGTKFEDLLHFFDMNVLNSEERAWVLEQLPPTSPQLPVLLRNAVYSSNLLPREAAARFQLDHPNVQWKCVFDSTTQDRLGTFLDTAARTMGMLHRKLLILRVDERLTVAIYVPKIIEQAQDCLVDDTVRLFAFPHSQGTETQSRTSLPTKKTYQLFCDDGIFQLFEGQRANTWVYIARGRSDDSTYRSTENVGDRRRQRQETVDAGKNFDYRVSIALNKFSSGLQKHVGRVNRNGLSAAEIYVISNRDVKSMRTLDLWIEHIDTEKRLPLFDNEVEDYTIANLKGVDWDSEPVFIVNIARRQNFAAYKRLERAELFNQAFTWLLRRNQQHLLLKSFDYLLANIRDRSAMDLPAGTLLPVMISFLRPAPFLALAFGRMEPLGSSEDDEYLAHLHTLLDTYSLDILRAYIMCAHEAQDLVIRPLQNFLSRVAGLSFAAFASLVELTALTVRQPTLATDILLECFERESPRLLTGRPAVVRHFVRNTIAIALDHVGECPEPLEDRTKTRKDLLKLKLLPEESEGFQVVEITFRIDSTGGTPERAAHVRLTAAMAPSNAPLATPYSIDALVTHSEQGLARFQCLHPLPPFYEACPWKLTYCGPFTTAKTMFDAVRNFAIDFEDCCGVANQLLLGDVPGSSSPGVLEGGLERVLDDYPEKGNLNTSQNKAVQATLNSPLTCLWGPPGTGKTETIVEIIQALQICFDKPRLLVTAPTHNAVDNVMRRYLSRVSATVQKANPHLAPLRVSTEIRKVAEDLRRYTCDAMVGKEIYADRRAMDQAKKQVQACGIIFTTCIGAGLGLLRDQVFDIVIVDEASQQTEPASLVPLVKGCEKAVLVGDHVQLRPTVTQPALGMEFDKSLFERLFNQPSPGDGKTQEDEEEDTSLFASPPFLARLMLDTQYRMHPSISAFPSAEFYDGALLTGVAPTARPLFHSAFPWPKDPNGAGDHARTVFVDCVEREALGGKSKTNQGQAELCVRVCRLLCTPSSETSPKSPTPPKPQTIAVLTPYAKQAELLKRLLSDLQTASMSDTTVEVSSIDGFQGREADIVVLVTVRCNEKGNIGFLGDRRRMNVALTRAKAGLVVVGNRMTLTKSTGTKAGEGTEGGESKSDVEEGGDKEGKELWRRLIAGFVGVEMEEPEGGESEK